MNNAASLSERIEALRKCIKSWFIHDRIHDHDLEIQSLIPDSLCLLLGYTLTMDTLPIYGDETSSRREISSENTTSQQILIGLICEAFVLIYNKCSKCHWTDTTGEGGHFSQSVHQKRCDAC